jgi:hypothetical protein
VDRKRPRGGAGTNLDPAHQRRSQVWGSIFIAQGGKLPLSTTFCTLYRSRTHERTILLRFLGIIFTVLGLKVSVWISSTIEYGFLSGFPPLSFTVYSN